LNLKHDILDRKIKLIWDFRGPEGFRTAEHHEKHLKEFIAMEKLPLDITGHEQMNEMHSLAYMVVNEKESNYCIPYSFSLSFDLLRPTKQKFYLKSGINVREPKHKEGHGQSGPIRGTNTVHTNRSAQR
jgi:hypothetical protein